MKYGALALCAGLVAAGLLSACADDYALGPPAAYAGVDYGAYYDGYYGPFYDGYWGPGGYFYYLDGRRYRRDGDHHFRHESGGTGYHPIHGHAPPAHGGGHPDRH